MNVQIPVEIVNLPRGLVISNQFKPLLDVTVTGPRGMIKKISEQSISRSIDLSEASPGNIVVNNAPDSIKFPRGIETLRINPTQIVLSIDKLIEKTISIESKSAGKLSGDYELDSITLEPNSLTLSGPLEVLKDIDMLETRAIDLTNMKSSSVKQISLNLLPEVANLIGESIVTARIKIRDKLETKNIRRIPITIEGLAENRTATIKPNSFTVTAQIPKALIRNTEKLSTLFKASTDVSALPDGTHEIKIEVKIPAGITVDEISPETAAITLTSKDPVIEKPTTSDPP
nr:hypothetical protein [Desulfobulbaceae bacterium]